jgi:hypothetical protein
MAFFLIKKSKTPLFNNERYDEVDAKIKSQWLG